MPYDPLLPATLSQSSSAVLRGQFHGVVEMIEAIPGVTGAVVDSITSVSAGELAAASASLDGEVVHFTFALPRGADGTDGLTGPAFTNFVVDTVTTLPPGSDASVEMDFDGTAMLVRFRIPRGADGTNGSDGEVTNLVLTSAIDDTAQNPAAVDAFTGTFSDPPTQAEMMALAAHVEELRAALRR